MKRIIFILLIFTAVFSLNSYADDKTMQITAGTNAPTAGMAMDASYDTSTDGIIPGYKILSVAITNNSIEIIQLDPGNDKWVVIDYKGSKHNAVVDLRKEDPKAYIALPEKLRRLIEYPLMIQVGDTKVIDLLVKNSVNLDAFRSVKYTNRTTKKSFEIVARD